MASNETTRKTLLVSLVLSLVCSVLVSASAVYLGPRQQENKVLDVQRNILAISGLVEHPEFMDREFVQQKFQAITPRLVDIRTGHYDTSGNDPRNSRRSHRGWLIFVPGTMTPVEMTRFVTISVRLPGIRRVQGPCRQLPTRRKFAARLTWPRFMRSASRVNSRH